MNKTVFLDTTDSTNRVAKELAEDGHPEGTSVLSEAQSQGRGRLGKSWSSPPGKGLYCSIILRSDLPFTAYPQLTFGAGLAVAQAIEEIYRVQIDLKWPNDIFIKGKKCGGILTESSALNCVDGHQYVVVGIGLNVNSRSDDFPPDIQHTATSLLIQSNEQYSITKLFEQVRRELLLEIRRFENEGFAQVIQRWRKRDFLKGKELQWVSVTGESVVGISLGPDDSGRLHVRDGAGVVHEILSGDIRLAGNIGK